jgi:hypothetical protein
MEEVGREEALTKDLDPDKRHSLPLQECPGSCSWHGLCARENKGPPRCYCYRGYQVILPAHANVLQGT